MNIVKRVAFAADFDAFFQPIVNARTGRIHHYEALARFPGADAALTPHDHISLAEQTGLITVFDMAMVRKMIAWLGGQSLRGQSLRDPPVRVAVNAFLQRLRRQGCLDDFGAGAATFEYLSSLDVDIVKLDGAWLHGARATSAGEGFLRELIGLCRELGVTTVAEMIEDEAAFDFARGCGVTYVQGFLFGEPARDIGAFRDSIPARLFLPKPAAPAPQQRRMRIASARRG